MSTSLLYHGFGIRGYEYQRTSYRDGVVVFTIRQARERLRCPGCRAANVHCRGHVRRQWQTWPIGGKSVFVELDVARVHCRRCRVVRQVPVPFADVQRAYTTAFARYVLELRRCMTIRDVARHLGVSDWMVKDIEKRHLEKHFARPKLKYVTRIAIDEISIGAGHRYLTVVLDLESGAVIYVGEGKGADALKPFWKRLKAAHALIEAVACDMSPAYIQAVVENLPEALLVFDHFHVVKLFNDRLSDFRRELYREATDQMHKDVLKGTRWLLLKNPDNLNDDKQERERLAEALSLNQPLATAYYLKEDLRQLWSQKSRHQAERFLKDWCTRARASGIRFLQKFANTLEGHRNGLLAWYDCPISTGPLEGTNNKIQTLKRQAYGYRDQHYFRLKIYALHEARFELIG
jgi:transposase